MSESDTPGAVRPNDLLGPLPERTLAEIHNPATGERELSETGAAYYGGNWREVRKLYTADDMRDYGRQERAAERERLKARAVQIVEWHRNDYNRQQIDRIVAELRNGL